MGAIRKMIGFVTIIALISIIALGCGGGGGSEEKAKEMFAQAQEFQNNNKYEEAIEKYREIAKQYPNLREGANSQFMIGFIYANLMNNFDKARVEFNTFLDKFSSSADSGLIAGAKFELANLGKSIEDIPVLSTLGKGADTTTADMGNKDKQ